MDGANGPRKQIARESPFWEGWRHGYQGIPKLRQGPDYERGWRHGHADRILDRSGSGG